MRRPSWLARIGLSSSAHGLWGEGTMDQEAQSERPPNTTVLLAKLIVKLWVLSAVLKLRLWWLSFLRNWLGQSGKPAILHPGSYQFALAHKKAKQLERGFSHLFDVPTIPDFPAGDFEPELTFDPHDEPEMVYTELTYYKIKRLDPHLAIVRYSCTDEDGTISVSEETYEDSLEDLERLQTDVLDSIDCGIDACVLTDQESEVFPHIHLLLASDGAV